MAKESPEKPDDSRTGEKWYEKIIKEHPDFLKKYDGDSIWIEPITGVFEIGDGIEAPRQAAKRAKKILNDRGETPEITLYTRKIGEIELLPPWVNVVDDTRGKVKKKTQ